MHDDYIGYLNEKEVSQVGKLLGVMLGMTIRSYYDSVIITTSSPSISSKGDNIKCSRCAKIIFWETGTIPFCVTCGSCEFIREKPIGTWGCRTDSVQVRCHAHKRLMKIYKVCHQEYRKSTIGCFECCENEKKPLPTVEQLKIFTTVRDADGLLLITELKNK